MLLAVSPLSIQAEAERTRLERRSGYLLAAQLPRISAGLTHAAMIRLLKPRREAIQTITLNNGSEFAGYEAMTMTVTAAIHFCYSYCSGQRGTNESINGLIRQYFPKGTDFDQVTDAELRKVAMKLSDGSAIGHPLRCFWGTQEVQTPQVLHLLLEFRLSSFFGSSALTKLLENSISIISLTSHAKIK